MEEVGHIYKVKSPNELAEEVATLLESDHVRDIDIRYYRDMPSMVPVLVFHDDDYEVFDISTYVLTNGEARVVSHYPSDAHYDVYLVNIEGGDYVIIVNTLQRHGFEENNNAVITVYGSEEAYNALKDIETKLADEEEEEEDEEEDED